MTTKQRLEYMLHQAAENKEGSGRGDPVAETVEGKVVVVQRVGYGRKVYGQRQPEFEASVNGVDVLMWRHGRKQVLEALYKKVSEDYIAKAKKAQEDYEREHKARVEREAAERAERDRKEAPARELAGKLAADVFAQMVLAHGTSFTSVELVEFLRQELVKVATGEGLDK